MKIKKTLAALFCATGLIGSVNAADVALTVGDVIAIDVSAASGTATGFNNLSGPDNLTIGAGSVIKYNATTDTASGVSVALTSYHGNGSGNFDNGDWLGAGGTPAGSVTDPYLTAEAQDQVFSSGDVTVTFSGLDPNAVFNVRVYATANKDHNVTDTFIVTGASSTSQAETRGNRFVANDLATAKGVFTNVAPSASGTIEVKNDSTGWSIMNAVVLEVATPPTVYDFSTEPATPSATDWFLLPDEDDGIDGSNLQRVTLTSWGIFGAWTLPAASTARTDASGAYVDDNDGLGIIESPVFTIATEGNGVVSFKHSGGNADCKFAAYLLSNDSEIAVAPNKQNTNNTEATFDLSRHKGQKVYFRLVDESTDHWGFKQIDDFSIEGTVDEAATTTRRNTITPAIGLEVSLTGTELVWTVEEEVDVKEYRVVNAETKAVLEVVVAVGADFYSIKVPEGVEVELVVVDKSGFSKSYAPEDGNVKIEIYDLTEGWNLIAITSDDADLETLKDETVGVLWGWNGSGYEVIETAKATDAVWVYSPIAKQVYVSGTKSDAGITLTAGWNMVGPVTETEVPAKADTVFGWGNEIYDTIANEQAVLIGGKGYWIFSL